MKLCELENHTFASVHFPEILEVVGQNILGGLLGVCMDRMLIRRELRKCRIIPQSFVGHKFENSSYSGVLGLLERKEIDIWLKGEPDYLHEEWLFKSPPMDSEQIILGHSIEEKKDENFYDLIDNFNIGITLLSVYFVTFVLIVAVGVFMDEVAHKLEFGILRNIKTSKKIIKVLDNLNVNQLTRIGIFALSIQMFFWFTQLFLINNTKTNKVVVDTSNLIKDARDVLSTYRTGCMLDKGQEMNMAETSPYDSLLKKIVNKKTIFRPDQIKERKIVNGDRCLLQRSPKMVGLSNSELYFVGSLTYTNFLFIFLANVGFRKKCWLPPFPVHEFNQVIYMNRRQKENPKYYTNLFYRYSENGIFAGMRYCIERRSELAYQKSLTIYRNLQEFVDSHSEFSSLAYGNFSNIFLGYFATCIFIFLHLCLHYLIKVRKLCIFA